MAIKKQIENNVKEILENNNINVPTYNGGFSYSDFGRISFSYNINIDISHIENFCETLVNFSDIKNSPIGSGGYYAVEIYAPRVSDIAYYILEYGYVFEDKRKISLEILKENCDDKMVDEIIKKADRLYSLGFGEIAFTYSSIVAEQFQNRVNGEANEITAGYYELEE